jgi:hypothetical protein
MFSFLENHLIFKRELVSPDAPVLTEVEEKLIRLACDHAATENEADVCGIKLIRSFRKRGLAAEQVVAAFTQSTWATRELMAARGYVVDFGKYKGKTVGEVSPRYLMWALKECDNMSFNLRLAMQLVLKART